MIKSLKRALVPLFISVLFGFICGKIVYNIYKENDDLSLSNNLVYLVQSGAYSSYDNMRANNISYDYIYYQEDDLFKTIIGVTKDINNIEKIKEVYTDEVIVSKYYSNNFELNSKLDEFDKLLASSEGEEIKNIIVEMLNLYKGDQNIKLIKVS